MSISDETYERLRSVDYGEGLTRDDLKARIPDLPDDIYLYLPSAKRFHSPEDVLSQTGANALARAEGGIGTPNLDLPVEGAEEDFGPPAYGPSLTGADRMTIGQGDYPGPDDDLAGNSIETSEGRGIPEENR